MLTLVVISSKVDILSRMARWSSGMILAYSASSTSGQAPLGCYVFFEVQFYNITRTKPNIHQANSQTTSNL